LSSLAGFFGGNGPLRLNSSHQYEVNPHGWHTMANLLFIDSPTGVGYSSRSSKAPNITSVAQVAEHYWQFCQEFLNTFPIAKSYEWHLNGESYAGMYVPFITDLFLKRNQKLQLHEHAVRLTSISIGNGIYFSPYEYPASSARYLDQVGYLADPLERERLFILSEQCIAELAHGGRIQNPFLYKACGQIGSLLSNGTFLMEVSQGKYCGSIAYDIRFTSCAPTNPYVDLVGNATLYLNQADVRQSLHVAAGLPAWIYLNENVMNALLYNGDLPSYPLLSKLLNQNILITLYHGDRDLLCNYVGIERALQDMIWKDQFGFQKGRFETVKQDGELKAGRVSERGLTYYRVTEAGHYVGFDQPKFMRKVMRDILFSASKIS
jgi:carboxypeptidase D